MDQRVTADLATSRSSEAAPRYVRRFDINTRLAHWALAIPFVLLMVTGLTNYAPRLKAVQVADVRLFAWLHVVLGFAMVVAAVLVVLTLLPKRAVREDTEAMADVSLDDYLWFQHEALRLTGQSSQPPLVKKFNAGQKANALLSGLATVALLGTGVILGINYTTKEVFDVSLVERVFHWHSLLSLLILPVVLGHLYLSLLNPSTRESFRGITRGVVRREWAQRHHPGWTPATPEEHSPRR